METLANTVAVAETNNESCDHVNPLHFSPVTAVRILDDSSILTNEFIAATIENSNETNISYQDGFVVLMVANDQLAHFLHLAYMYADGANTITVELDNTYTSELIDDLTGIKVKFIGQGITLTENNID